MQRAPPAWKFCAAQSQERFDRENAQRADQANMNGRRFFDCRKWKTTARPRKTLPGSPDQGQQNKCAQKKPSRGHPQGPRGSGSAPRLPSWGCAVLQLRPTPGGCPPARLPMGATVGQQVGLRAPQKVTNAPINPNLFRNLQETQRIEQKAFRARADAAQSARQGGTEPGTTRFRDGRATTGPPAPRRGPGAPTAEARPRGPDLEKAQI